MALYPELFRLPNRLRQVLLALSIGVIVAVSMKHGHPPESGEVPFHKEYSLNFGHQILYGFFSLTALLRLPPRAPQLRQTWLGLLAVVLVMGFFDEWNQSTRNRGSGMLDIGSDLLGCLHILILTRWFSLPRAKGASLRLILLLIVLGLAWNLVVVFAPDPPLPFVS